MVQLHPLVHVKFLASFLLVSLPSLFFVHGGVKESGKRPIPFMFRVVKKWVTQCLSKCIM